MSLKERVYSVLVVSVGENLNSTVSALLPDSSFSPVQIAGSVSAAKRIVAERDFDLIIINSPLPDDPGVRFAVDLCSAKNSVVLLLVRSDVHDSVYDRVAVHGVFTLPKPTSRSALSQALSWMVCARERLKRFEKTTLSVQEKMEEIRLVNRAKWLLISSLQMDEPHAHRYIEKQAMDRCITKREVAEDIIKTYS